MRNDIREKLHIELNKKIEGEPQVVYVLSRVRKMLEIGGKEKEAEYSKLKFYCDWALHSKINNVGAVKDLLDGVIAKEGKATLDLIINYDAFHFELKKFLQENDLRSIMYESKDGTFLFNMFLSSIYSDTPLIIDYKTRIIWKGSTGDNAFGGIFKVEDIEN